MRQTARRRLLNRELQIIFTVDLFNEGVDIPQVDTLLFLRPTESLTVYLQQLGRGLRLHEGKANLTVLDFIAPQHRRFSFADRFRALSNRKDQRVDRQIQAGFPWLPAGCLVRLDEKATEVILADIRNILAQRRPQIIGQLASLRQAKGDAVSLTQMLDWLHLDDPDLLLKHGLPSSLMAEAAGRSESGLGKYEKGLVLGLRQLLIADDRDLLVALKTALQAEEPVGENVQERILLALAMVWGTQRPAGGWQAALHLMRAHAGLKRDALQVVGWRLDQLLPVHHQRAEGQASRAEGQASRAEGQALVRRHLCAERSSGAEEVKRQGRRLAETAHWFPVGESPTRARLVATRRRVLGRQL